MAGPPDGESDRRSRRAEALADYHRRLGRGEAVDRERFLDDYPDVVAELRAHWEAADAVAEFAADLHDQAGVVEPPVLIRYFGDYALLGEVGRGGMGVVYEARQESLGRRVAVKLIRDGHLADDRIVHRFRREAEASARLAHPNIVAIHEVGEHQGQHFYSMDFVAGPNLAYLLIDGPLPPRRSSELIREVALAVQYAHEQGVIHRDLKPHNILLDPSSRARVADFGLAKILEADEPGSTATGQVLGSPGYMPPEQAEGRPEIGPAADVYALGATLYACLTGRPPFQAATVIETLEQVRHVEPVSPRALNPAVPRDLETITLKCLEKEPSRRYASAAALADDLGRWLGHEPIRARRIGPVGRLSRWCRRRPTVAALAVSLVVVLVAGFGLVTALWLEARAALRSRAEAQVRALLAADPEAIPTILAELEASRDAVLPSLRAQARRADLTPGQRRRVALALRPVDRGQAAILRQALRDCPLRELPTIRDALAPDRDALVPTLRESFHDSSEPSDRRLRTGLALAAFDPGGPDWTEADATFLVERTLRAHPDDSRTLRQGLRPLAARLIEPLRRRLRDSTAAAADRRSAALVLADFAASDGRLLATLAAEAGPEEASIFNEILVTDSATRAAAMPALRDLARRSPTPNLDETARVRLGRQRAGAALTRMALGQDDAVADVARLDTDDPEALTQFAFQARSRGLPADVLADRLLRTETEAERSLLLTALADYRPEELPPNLRKTLNQTLDAWYHDEPSLAVHGACIALLREWGRERPPWGDTGPPGPDPTGQRRWFVRRIGDDEMTFVTFPPGRHAIGTPLDEADREEDEVPHEVQFTRPFAIADRELTPGQFERFLRADRLPILRYLQVALGDCAPTGDHPALGVVWFEAILYCRWLTQQVGLTESDQCYDDPDTIEKGPDGVLRHWPFHPERAGFPLPTEAEWEIACRAGTRTRYAFGSDAALFPRYGWSLENAHDQSHLVGTLQPNPAGLFDMHGNAFEWCQDLYGDYDLAATTDPMASPAMSPGRVLRGGSWMNEARFSRSGLRIFASATQVRDKMFGFRLAITLPSTSGEPDKKR